MAETFMDTGSGGRYGDGMPLSFSNVDYARYSPSDEDYVGVFLRLLRTWRHKTLTESSTDKILLHDEFRQIVELGEKVIPLIVDEIRIHPDHLMAALLLITDEDPVPEAARGDFLEMANAWIAWYDRRR